MAGNDAGVSMPQRHPDIKFYEVTEIFVIMALNTQAPGNISHISTSGMDESMQWKTNE